MAEETTTTATDPKGAASAVAAAEGDGDVDDVDVEKQQEEEVLATESIEIDVDDDRESSEVEGGEKEGEEEGESLLKKEPSKEDKFEDEPPAGSGKNNPNDHRSINDWLNQNYEVPKLPRKYQLVTEKTAMERSIQSVRFTILCSAVNTKMLNPNYPIMVTPGAHPDSFDNTEPFDFNSATYFLPMCSLLGVAISSIFLGQISDRVGRKSVLLVLAWVSCVGSIAKVYLTGTFWMFAITQFIFGFFLGNLPVGMAYVGDVFTTKNEKDKELGVLVSYFVMGNSGGGIIAILMNDSGLFTPLWVGAGLLAVAAVFTSWYMIEPGKDNIEGDGNDDENLTDALLVDNKKQNEEDDAIRPETIDNRALNNIVWGAIFDNFGSTALFPLCLSPLAIEQYLFDLTNADPPQDPIMSMTGYQWLSVCVAFMVVPATVVTPPIFAKIGVAGTCVFGNSMTAVITLILLLIGNGPATTAMFALFVSVMYAGFPMTVFSQLTTGPMLDVIAPKDKIGYVQGLNNAAMNFGMAIAPWLFGILADKTNTNIAIITGICISVIAALINSFLMCDSRFGRTKPLPPVGKRVLEGEDEEFVQRALDGELVDQSKLLEINLERLKDHKPMIVPKIKTYAEEKESGEILNTLYDNAYDVFEERLKVQDRILEAMNDPQKGTPDKVEEFCSMLNDGIYNDPESLEISSNEIGQWIGDYLKDVGYTPHTTSVLLKQMVLTAFPPINEAKEYTPENLEDALVRTRQVFNRYLDVHEKEKKQHWTFAKTMSTAPPIFYS